jgi:hypothetical protein
MGMYSISKKREEELLYNPNPSNVYDLRMHNLYILRPRRITLVIYTISNNRNSNNNNISINIQHQEKQKLIVGACLVRAQ